MTRSRLAGLAVAILVVALAARIIAFQFTKPIRVPTGLNNAWLKGSDAVRRGQGNTLDGIVAMYEPAHRTHIDYPPIRMYIKTSWAHFTLARGLAPHAEGSASARFDHILWPMFMVNGLFEFAAAIALYKLCRLRYSPSLSLIPVAAIAFNPAIILNSFCWPQWDVWPIAPLLTANFLLLHPAAAKRLWPFALAGVCLALATSFKGQSLFVASYFLLACLVLAWRGNSDSHPSLQRRLQRSLSALALMLLSLAATIFLITLPFTLRGSGHWLSVYSSQFQRELPLTVNAWNLPHALQSLLGATPSTGFTLPLLHLRITLIHLLLATFILWTLLTCWRALRTTDRTRALVAPGIIFAAMFAIMPCMYERYSIWTVALAAPLLLTRRTPVALAYAFLTLVSLCCQLNYCLLMNPTAAPALARWIDQASPLLGLIWFLSACTLTAYALWTPTPPNPPPSPPCACSSFAGGGEPAGEPSS